MTDFKRNNRTKQKETKSPSITVKTNISSSNYNTKRQQAFSATHVGPLFPSLSAPSMTEGANPDLQLQFKLSSRPAPRQCPSIFHRIHRLVQGWLGSDDRLQWIFCCHSMYHMFLWLPQLCPCRNMYHSLPRQYLYKKSNS